MSSPSVLDVTLRDGGYVNDFCFGSSTISLILDSLSHTNIEGVEIGFLRDCSYTPDRTCFNKVQQAESLLEDLDDLNESYFLMIRPDWFEISNLEPCSGKIKNLRFAFHCRDLKLLDYQVKRAQDLGYLVYLNPVNITSYSLVDLSALLFKINSMHPNAVAIVDTFGSLTNDELVKVCDLFDQNLDSRIAVCLHPHDNLLLAFSLAQSFIKRFLHSRRIWIDSSINGMGRAPGNLQSELLLNYLNSYYGSAYKLHNLYCVLSHVVSQFKVDSAWGYHPAYAISAFKKVHRSYAEYLIHKTDLDLGSIAEALEIVSDHNEKEAFNESFVVRVISLTKARK